MDRYIYEYTVRCDVLDCIYNTSCCKYDKNNNYCNLDEGLIIINKNKTCNMYVNSESKNNRCNMCAKNIIDLGRHLTLPEFNIESINFEEANINPEDYIK